jgi:hypothetical protein
MKLIDILTKIGSNALKTIPEVSIVVEIIDLINSIVPKEYKVSENSTGKDVIDTLNSFLSQNAKDIILNKKFDISVQEIKSHEEIIKAIAEVDKMGKSTRPFIAKIIAVNTIFIVDIIIAGVVYAVYTGNTDIVKEIKDSWPLILSLLTPFIVLLKSYFGLRTKEKSHKYEIISNTPTPLDAISKILKAFSNK